VLAWVGTAVWTQVLIVAAFAVVYAIGRGSSRLAARSRAPYTTERAVLSVVTAVGIAEFLRRFVLPSLGLEGSQSAVIGAALGIAVSWTWSGLARRTPDPHASLSGRHPRWSARRASVYLAAILLAALWALAQVERIDWAFVAQRTIVVLSWMAAFLIVLNTKPPARTSRALRPVLAAMAAAAVVAFVTPQALGAYAATTADARWQADDVLDRYSGGDVGVRLLLRAFAGGTDFDPEYYRLLQVQSGFAGPVAVTAPAVEFSSAVKARAPRKPDVFVISLDSLRRDYLAPYNPRVAFTPSIADFAKDSFVFSNAFTRHGGTELAIPSMWAGAMVVRQLRSAGFERMNAFEKLVRQEGYRLLLNDFTIADNLRADTPVTRLNPGVASIDTDLCGNLRELESVLSGAGAGREPVFAFLAPMNVHILNTQRGGQASLDGDYPGFFAPYASRLRRVDACFGNFISFLRQTGRYDDAMIVLTTDHGDSLGEDGYWGHSTWLTPEIIRIPLVIKVPQALRAGLATDLDRIAFSTDIAPTLYSVLQHDVRDLGPFFGAPLFVPQGATLQDRRSQSFLVTASYGPAYGIVSGDGRSLYVTDLLERREVFYDMSTQTRSRSQTAPAEVREGSQREIRRQVLEIGALYQLQGRAAPGKGGKVARIVETGR
jgi:membrane-anchored protein YejM (alkaline phosphatase superfamily)